MKSGDFCSGFNFRGQYSGRNGWRMPFKRLEGLNEGSLSPS